MINVVISLFIMVVSFNFFYITYQVCGVNRVVLSTPVQIFEKSISLISNNDEPNLYFQKITLISNLSTYYEALKKYTDNYSIDYRFYNAEDQSICTSNECKAVNISVTAHLTFSYTVYREIYYEIQRN